MKILLVAPLRRKVGPAITASRPRFVFDLATHLINHGHQVAILGTQDSEVPGATIIPILPHAINDLPAFENKFYAETAFLVETAMKMQELSAEYDIVHNNSYPEFINLLRSDSLACPLVTTIHAPATSELDSVLSLFPHACLVSPSLSQKNSLTKTVITAVIPHGTDTSLYAYSDTSDNYLLWIGRLGLAKNKDGQFIDGKGVRTAIAIAQATREKLLMTGNVEDQAFFDRDVKPFLTDKIQWVGELSSEQPLAKSEIAKLMQKAKGILITTRFAESFGLTAIEAMSCGTPVIGFKRGAIPEIVEDGVHGFTVENISEKTDEDNLIQAVNRLYALSDSEYLMMRKKCRDRIDERYSLEVMVKNYISLYESLLNK